MKSQGSSNSYNNVEKEEQSWRTHTLPDIRFYFKTTVIKTA